MSEISVVKIKTEFPNINLKLMKENIRDYELAMIVVYTVELERGLIVKKINKTTNKGTKVTFVVCKSQEEANEYSEKVNDLIKEYNKKYNVKCNAK